jgi:beta-xylosidase
MATPKQTAAHRTNARKSTGPRTPAGKAVSRFNALKHGIYAVHRIMFDEKPEDLAELSAEYHEHHSPANSDESFLVDTLVHNQCASAARAASKPSSGRPPPTPSW